MPEMLKNRYTFVAVFGNKIVNEGFLYSSVQGEPNRIRIEEALQKSCNVLTKGQRCADWFLMKMMVTGTMAGKSIQLLNFFDNSADISSKKDNGRRSRSIFLRCCYYQWPPYYCACCHRSS